MEKINRLIFSFLFAAIVCAVGCAVPKPTPNPLAGWNLDLNHKPNSIIVEDYQNYIQKLSAEERKYVDKYSIWFYQDGTGQHAIRIEIPLNQTWWEHVLIYDKDSKRIQTIKYSNGHYAS